MKEDRLSVAHTMVVTGLVLQFILTVLQILQSYSMDTWVSRLMLGHGEPVLGTFVLLLLLALIVPALRGWRWVIAFTVVVQALLTIEMIPWLLRKFANTEAYAQWILNLGYVVVGGLAVVFGVVAVLEKFGKVQKTHWSLRGRIPRQVLFLLLVLTGFTGMSIAGAGTAQRPLETSTLPGVPDEVITVSMDLMTFAPARLELPAGKRVALVLANQATDEHSFDLDAQDIHVRVPAKSTAIAIVDVPASGEIPFRCDVPGHTEGGMTGVIVAS